MATNDLVDAKTKLGTGNHNHLSESTIVIRYPKKKVVLTKNSYHPNQLIIRINYHNELSQSLVHLR